VKVRWKQAIEKADGWTDWIKIHDARHRIACCDCGLVHDLEFELQNDVLMMRARRNMRSTAQRRRHLKPSLS